MRKLVIFIAIVIGAMFLSPLRSAIAAEKPTVLKMPAIFADNMVLQRGIAAPVWGWAAPGEQITVSFREQKKTATANADGKWMLKLDAMTAGGPWEMDVAGNTSITIRNVMVGEVWICSGQSNMEFQLRSAHNAKEAIAESKNTQLRHFTLIKAQADQPLADCRGKWEEADPAVSGNFTAVGYFFGRKLQKDLGVPVGLIHTSWGGTPIEVWMSVKCIESDPDTAAAMEQYNRRVEQHKAALLQHQAKLAEIKAAYDKEVEIAKQQGRPAPAAPKLPAAPGGPGWKPAVLYNAMIAPIVPYAVGGAIWYQGESNAGNAKLYRKQMPMMIQSWRDDFACGEFPFLMVSLANFMQRREQPSDSGWAELREAQALTAQTCPKTGVAIAIDVGDAQDIHPRDKQSVGERLELNALALGYGKQIEYSGPVYEAMKIDGGKIRLSFKHIGGGLVAKDGDLKGFAIAGEDRKFVWADAKIDGESIVVSSPQVAAPVAVRYAWADNPECNLYNEAGLPAVPFRTDDWARK